MQIINTPLKGCVVIEPHVFRDERGFFLETFHQSRYSNMAGIEESLKQDNLSRSEKGVLRGLHFQRTNPQGKLVSVVSGSIFHVALDIRTDSDTFGQWTSQILSEENKRQFWIPPGFAHGFLVLTDLADVLYKMTDYYDHEDEAGVLWNDPSLNIPWPISQPIISPKDNSHPLLSDIYI